MKLKDSIIIILVFIIAIVIGVFAGVKFTEGRQENTKVNQGEIVDKDKENDKVNEENENNSDLDEDVNQDNNGKYFPINENIEDYLKENNISYVNPRENGQKVFDSSEKASNNFTLGTEDVTMTMYSNDLEYFELYIKINDKKIKVDDIIKYSTVYAYTYNNYLLIYTQFSGGTLWISIYDSSLNELISIDSDNYGVPLFSENFIYYGVKDCNGPGEIGDIAVYKENFNTKEKTFLVYLKHEAGWACW